VSHSPLRGAAWREERERRERELSDATLNAWRTLAEQAGSNDTIDTLIAKALAAGENPGTAQVGQLRRLGDAALVHAALELAKARRKAKHKFASADVLADPEGAEMASSSLVASYKASRLHEALAEMTREGSRHAFAFDVLDVCSGIGGDAMAFAQSGLRVHAIDLNPMRAALCGANLRRAAHHFDKWAGNPQGASLSHQATTGKAEDAAEQPQHAALLHIDPSRRTPQTRMQASVRTSPHESQWDELQPSAGVLANLLERSPHACIKQRAGLDLSDLPAWLAGCEAEIISEAGKLTQCLLWTGHARSREAREFSSEHAGLLFRRATLLKKTPSSELVVHSLCGPKLSEAAPFAPIQEFVYEPDDSIERADLLPQLCSLLAGASGVPVGMAHPKAGLLSAPAAFASPWVRGFAVLANEPFATKSLAKLVSRFEPGIVEVKTRAKLINPDEWQPKLSGKGPNPLAVFVLRFGDDVRTLVTRRLPASP
jgi:hypothetical protein